MDIREIVKQSVDQLIAQQEDKIKKICKELEMTPEEFFTDYVLVEYPSDIEMGIGDSGERFFRMTSKFKVEKKSDIDERNK